MDPTPLLLISDERMLGHRCGPNHPERPARLQAVVDALGRAPPGGRRWAAPTPAPMNALLAVHTADHLDRLRHLSGLCARLDPDTGVSPGSVQAAWLAAGASIQATDAVLDGTARRAFALVRPPGHHAEADRAMGFCLLNNVAIAAAHAIARGIGRVLIVDWDVHHGNGTQRTFYDRDDVCFFSTHQFPFYPGSGSAEERGAGRGRGFTLNVPLPAGFGDEALLAAFRDRLAPAARAWRPDLLLVSAGFDAHVQDPLAAGRVTSEGFAAVCQIVGALADELAGGRLALVLEGGYDLEALTASVTACADVLSPPLHPERPDPDQYELVG